MQSLHHFNWAVKDIEFLLWDQFKLEKTLLNNESLADADITKELLQTLLYQAQEFAVKELDPINIDSDKEGCSVDAAGRVTLPSHFPSTWEKFKEAGWTEMSNPVHESICLPQIALQSYLELMFGACPSFMLYGGFGMPIAQLIKRFGNTKLQTTFIEKLLTLVWGGCFCMTEPQAGSDVGGIRTRATLQEDGRYLIEGEKIFITAGMHDLVENLVYLVVARTPNAPQGTFGLSCFLVSRFALENGELTQKTNGVRATRVEKKMGLSGCATTALSFGLDEPCYGYLLGEHENTGLQHLSSLMALARMSTGLIGLGIASKAYQNAAAYAHQRFQGVSIRQVFNPSAKKVAIIEHADVKRMLLEMKSKVEGCRALLTKLSFHYTHTQLNQQSALSLSEAELCAHERWIGLLTPLVKAYISNQSWRICELAIQVYGGHGYIRENPVEQAARDCKILSIWEGTNFLQSAELVRDKCAMGRPSASLELAINTMIDFLEVSSAKTDFSEETDQLEKAIRALQKAHEEIGKFTKSRQIDHIFFNSTRFLNLLAETIILWLLLEAAVIAKEKLKNSQNKLNESDEHFLQGKIESMRYFAHYEIPFSLVQADIIANAKPLAESTPSAIFM